MAHSQGANCGPVPAVGGARPDQGVLDLGRATLEVFDERQATTVDEIEAGRRVSGRVRFALRVPDLDAAVERLDAHGVRPEHGPVVAPWGDRTARFEDPDGMQVTLYESTKGDEAG